MPRALIDGIRNNATGRKHTLLKREEAPSYHASSKSHILSDTPPNLSRSLFHMVLAVLQRTGTYTGRTWPESIVLMEKKERNRRERMNAINPFDYSLLVSSFAMPPSNAIACTALKSG